jgi:hypothetical protein
MGQRFGAVVEEILRDHGVEVTLEGPGSGRCARFQVPPGDVPTVRAVLARHRVATRGGTRMTATVAPPGDDPEGEDQDFQALVASWRQFIQRSGERGFRKASRAALRAHPRDPLGAAQQILGTLRTARRGPAGEAFYQRLRRAVRVGNPEVVRRLLGVLAGDSGGEEYRIEEPEAPAPARSRQPTDPPRAVTPTRGGKGVPKAAPFQGDPPPQGARTPRETFSRSTTPTRGAGRRRAGPTKDLWDSATRHLQDMAAEQAWESADVRRVGTMLGSEYRGWRDTLQGVDDDDASTVWGAAADAVAHFLEDQANQGDAFSEHGDQGVSSTMEPPPTIPRTSSPRVFGTGTTRFVPRRQELVAAADRALDHFIAKGVHPEDVSDREALRWIHRNYPSYPGAKVLKLLREYVRKSIPRRNPDEDE